MHLYIKHFVVFITILSIISCRESEVKLTEIHGSQIAIEESLKDSDSIEQFIAPYRSHVNSELDAPLSYAPALISKNDGRYNSSAGNLMADIIIEQGNPVFKNRTKKDIDFAVMNHGGIRSVISAGNVSARTAYEVMPFENEIAVVGMQGKSVRDLVSFLIRSSRPHPISGMEIVLNPDGSLRSVNINGAPFDENRIYYVATSDYLVKGGDDMSFFEEGLEVTTLDYQIRKAMIDYFAKTDTIKAVVDDRFIRLK